MPTPPSQDDALLARLNALKKSSVSFDTTPIFSPNRTAPSTQASNPSTFTAPNTADTLAARFARLGSPSPSSSPKPSRITSTDNTPIIAPGAPSYLEGVAEGLGGSGEDGTQFNEEDERSLEELLGELGDRGDWDLKRGEAEDVGKMLRDVKSILPDVKKSREREDEERGKNGKREGGEGGGRKEGEELTDWENVEVDVGSGGIKLQQEEQDEENGEEGKKPTEDEEADDVIARIMAELAIQKKYDIPPKDDEDDHSESGDQKSGSREARPTTSTPKDDNDDEGGLSLPSAPTSFPDPASDTQSIEDSLAARFASLSSPSPSSKPQTDALGLPSAPSFHPSAKPPKVTSTVKHTDEEIDTWCIICNDDATLKCLGCDNDLYCQNCWMEGHRGPDAGWEEKRHKAVLYSKKKKELTGAG